MTKMKRTTRIQRDIDFLHALGRWVDQWPNDEWPPLLPNREQIAAIGGFDPEVAGRKMDAFSKMEQPLLVRHGHRYTMTIHCLRWMNEHGYLKRYLVAADGEWGIRVAKLRLLYPTS